MPKIVLSSPVREIKGKFANSDIVYFTGKNGQTLARSQSAVANPRTASQVAVRSFMTVCSKAWQTLSDIQREDWLIYSRAYFTRARDGSPLPPNGMNAFVAANTIRLILGQTVVKDAPTEAPPPPLTSIGNAGGLGPDSVGIDITHSIADVTGLQVIVSMTPQMLTLSRTPNPKQMRYCCGVDSDSAKPLTASGTTLVYSPTIYSIDEGGRFGVEARVVRTADGIMSNPVMGDFIKAV
jgi:hypothetical protein